MPKIPFEIASLDQLLDYAVRVKEGEATWEDANILPTCATISIRVCGPGWDKCIDARGAKYITDMQKRLDRLYAEYPEQLPDKAPFIKVEIHAGSNALSAFFEPFVREIVTKMSPEDIVAVLKYGITCVAGIWGLVKGAGVWVNRLNKKTEQEIAEREHTKEERLAEIEKEKQAQLAAAMSEAQMKTLEVLSGAIKRIDGAVPVDREKESLYTQPIREYAKGLADRDRISVSGLPPIPAEYARPAFKGTRRPKSQKRFVACDGMFHCMGINLEQPKPRLVIEQDGKTRLALLERLEKSDREILLAKVDKRLETQAMPFEIQLQLDVYFDDRDIQWCTVVGFDAPRTDRPQYGLGDIPHGVVDSLEAE